MDKKEKSKQRRIMKKKKRKKEKMPCFIYLHLGNIVFQLLMILAQF